MKVREVVKLLEQNGWQLVRTRGSHRVFKHPHKRGILVVAGKPGADMPKGTLHAILRESGIRTGRKYE